MPFWFYLAIFLALVAVVAGLVWFFGRRAAGSRPTPEPSRRPYERYPATSSDTIPGYQIAGLVAVVAAVLACLFTLISSWNQVGTQNVGIVTSFGRPVGDVGNGLHFLPPWDEVTEMDNAIQTDLYEGPGECIQVRIAEQQTACASVRIRWQMIQSAGDRLFRNYRTSDGVRASLVTSELTTALNQQFDSYDPISSLTSSIPLGQPGNPTVAQVAEQVTTQMRRELAGQVKVFNVLVPIITYDSTVQDRLNSVLAQKAQTDIALQAEKTAAAQAAANRALAASQANTPFVFQQNCLNVTVEAMKAGYGLPQGWNCSGASSVGVLTTPRG